MNKMQRMITVGGLILCSSVITPIAEATDFDRLLEMQLVQATPQQQGIDAYHQGDYRSAQIYLEKAVEMFRQQGDRPNLAYTLNLLCLTQQQLGLWEAATSSIQAIFDLGIEDLSPLLHAQTLNNQGRLQLQQGETEAAFSTWQEAEKIYRSIDDLDGIIGVSINQAQALQALGQYLKARNILSELTVIAQQQADPELQVKHLRSLGSALQVIGQLEDKPSAQLSKNNTKTKIKSETLEINSAKTAFLKSLAIAETQGINPASIYLSLGNIAKQQGKNSEAIAHYEQAYDTAVDETIRVKSLLNQLQLLAGRGGPSKTAAMRSQLKQKIALLPNSRDSIYTLVNFADTLRHIEDFPKTEIAEYLAQARQQALDIGDRRAESYALGTLGELYFENNQLDQARAANQQALALAIALQAKDVAFRWQWQLGEIHNALAQKSGDRPSTETQNQMAADYYDAALTSLQQLRQDLVATSTETQFTFTENVEPIYRQYVDLLLTTPDDSIAPSQDRLKTARAVIESLQLAELDNFFRDACLTFVEKEIEQIITENDPNAAVVYPIVLPDRLAVITSLPDQTLQYHSTSATEKNLELVIQKMRNSINPYYPSPSRIKLSLGLYQWLIKPFEAQFAAQDVQTLVFVLDGSLRNLPMAALYDGEQYLIEKYAIALTPGLKLFESPKLSNRQLQQVIIGGLTEARQGFAPLPAVAAEVEQISAVSTEEILLNETFQRSALRKVINDVDYPVVHLATHGQFSSDPDETFLLMWDQKLSIDGLKSMLQQRENPGKVPIDLMILSACETATGDKRAALGLAGLAVRSGVRTTVATLWSVNDASTSEFMTAFYQALREPNLNKSEALRKAQLALLADPRFDHPYYWAPFVMVGNWF